LGAVDESEQDGPVGDAGHADPTVTFDGGADDVQALSGLVGVLWWRGVLVGGFDRDGPDVGGQPLFSSSATGPESFASEAGGVGQHLAHVLEPVSGPGGTAADGEDLGRL
jgi:hypothetical protein